MVLGSTGPSPSPAARADTGPGVRAALAATTVAFVATTTDVIADGVRPRHGRWRPPNGPQVVGLIDFDPAAPGISLEASGPAAGPNTLETVRRQATRVSR